MLEEAGKRYYYKGLALSIDKRLTEAIGYLKQAIILQYDQPNVYNVMGLCWYKLGDLSEAQAMWQKSIQRDADEKNRAYEYMQILKTKSSKRFVQNYNDALIYMKEKQYRKAEKSLCQEEVIRLQNVQSLNLLGLSRYAQGKKRGAMQSWQQAMQIDSSHTQTLYYMMCCEIPTTKLQKFIEFIGVNKRIEKRVNK